MEYEPVRFNQLQRYIGKVPDKALSQTPKEFETGRLILRTASNPAQGVLHLGRGSR